MEKELLEYFKVMPVRKLSKTLNYQFMTKGLLLDFIPNPAQEKILNEYIREEISLKSRGNLIGFVRNKTFIVFYGRMNESRVSAARNKVMITKALTMYWTLKGLFDYVGVDYVSEAKKPDYDLSYAGFTFDKLEKLLGV